MKTKILFLILLAPLIVFGQIQISEDIDSESNVGPTQKGKFLISGATGLQFISSNIEYEYDGDI